MLNILHLLSHLVLMKLYETTTIYSFIYAVQTYIHTYYGPATVLGAGDTIKVTALIFLYPIESNRQ